MSCPYIIDYLTDRFQAINCSFVIGQIQLTCLVFSERGDDKFSGLPTGQGRDPLSCIVSLDIPYAPVTIIPKKVDPVQFR